MYTNDIHDTSQVKVPILIKGFANLRISQCICNGTVNISHVVMKRIEVILISYFGTNASPKCLLSFLGFSALFWCKSIFSPAVSYLYFIL